MAGEVREPRLPVAAALAVAALGVYGWSSASPRPPSPGGVRALPPPPGELESAPTVAAATISESQLDGRAFPDHVLALTWDDGPDAQTLALASYLHDRRIAGTFFVVGAWSPALSSDPGWGRGVFETGYERLPVLGDLVRLGHRLGNHTRHHATLTDLGPDRLDDEVRGNQARLDPLLASELRLLRAPGGAWSVDVARALARDPYTAGLVGPVRWDVDRKDWDGSVSCASDRPAFDCQPSSIEGRPQTRPAVMALRYLESVEAAGRGIVLLHDRVGQVGSTYALEVARALVPALEQRGYVFAAPVLAFSPLSLREREPPVAEASRLVGMADVDGDGRADFCRPEAGTLRCALSTEVGPARDSPTPRAVFEEAPLAEPGLDAAAWSAFTPSGAMALGDVNGDGRADACGVAPGGIHCALATGDGRFSAPELWSRAPVRGDELLLGDLDGDSVADLCARSGPEVRCARSVRAAFTPLRIWASLPGAAPAGSALADVDGDGRVDLCVATPEGVACGLARAGSFAPLAPWSAGGDLATTEASRAPRFGDLNGDGRADVCAWDGAAVRCALSAGARFTSATAWTGPVAGGSVLRLADVNGDGRADLCAETAAGFACGMAP